jgi:hypothetical protein
MVIGFFVLTRSLAPSLHVRLHHRHFPARQKSRLMLHCLPSVDSRETRDDRAIRGCKENREATPDYPQGHQRGPNLRVKGGYGEWEIDPAELFRVYPPVSMVDVNERPKMDAGLHSIDSGLQREVDVLRERLTEKDTIIEDLRRDRDEWRRQDTALLTDQRPRVRRRVWPWVMAGVLLLIAIGIAGWAGYSGRLQLT